MMGLVQGVPGQSQETSWTALMRDAVASMPATSTPIQAAQPRPAGLPLSQPPAWRTSSHPAPAPVSQQSESAWLRSAPPLRVTKLFNLDIETRPLVEQSRSPSRPHMFTLVCRSTHSHHFISHLQGPCHGQSCCLLAGESARQTWFTCWSNYVSYAVQAYRRSILR